MIGLFFTVGYFAVLALIVYALASYSAVLALLVVALPVIVVVGYWLAIKDQPMGLNS